MQVIYCGAFAVAPALCLSVPTHSQKWRSPCPSSVYGSGAYASKLLEYLKLSISNYYLHRQSSSPASFSFCEVDNRHFCCSLSLAGCRLSGRCSHFTAIASCQPA